MNTHVCYLQNDAEEQRVGVEIKYEDNGVHRKGSVSQTVCSRLVIVHLEPVSCEFFRTDIQIIISVKLQTLRRVCPSLYVTYAGMQTLGIKLMLTKVQKVQFVPQRNRKLWFYR